MHQPKNNLAPWVVMTDSGVQVSIEDDGLYASGTTNLSTIKFSDGSTLSTAHTLGPTTTLIDGGTF